MELNFLVTLVSILTLLVAQTSLLDPGPQVDKFVNLENDPAMKHPYLQRYTLISTYIPTLKGKNRTIRSKRHSLVTGKECHHLSIVINATKHTFCIFEERLVENDVAKRDTKIIVHGSTDTQTYRLEDLNITVARGYDIVNTDAGSVEGYIEDFRFFGRVIVQSSTYYLEPVRKFPSILKKLNKLHKDDFALNQAILYEAKDAAFQSAFAANVDRIRLGTVDTNMPSAGSHENLTRPVHLPVKPFTFHKFGSPEIVRGRVCEMLLLGDHLLLRDVANGNISQAVAFLLRAADVANLVFRHADFDGDGLADNVGVSVKHLVVLTDADLPQNHVHNLGDEMVPIDGRIYLQYVSTYGVLERVCVGAAFTSRRFKARALGLSYTAMGETVSKEAPMVGGICERPLQTGLNFNVLAISVTAEKGTRMPELTISLSLAHELGHSFGSGHDPETGACSDHLMCPISLTGTKLSHYTFSACSRPKIRHVIEQKGFCLVADSNSFCGNALTADNSYYRHHRASIAATVRDLLTLLEDAGAIYRVADMDDDGVPDNLGLSVAVVVVTASSRNPLAAEFASTQEYLRQFSLVGHEEFCLAVAFTHRNFGDGTLGASWLGNVGELPPGGICQKPVYLSAGGPRESFNTVMVATRMRSGDELPVQMSVLNIAHEIGHSFGSLHDDVHRNKMTCDPDDSDKYLMAAYSLWGDGLNNAHFSSCSRRRMRRVLEAKGECLRVVPHADAFCGNGLLEGDEECDCGLPLDCQQRDPCCNPRGTYRQCKVNSKYPCHPSQGPCCLPTCQYRDLSNLGLNCALENRGCPCKGTDSRCSCGLQGECIGNQCHSGECARLGLEECTCLPSAGTACMTCCREPRGECKPAVQLTVQQVSAGNVSVGALRRVTTPHTTRSSTVRVERVCDDAEECVDAVFRVWPSGSLCVARGKLGHCSNLGVCDISRIRGSEFPRFERLVESRASIVWTSSMLLVWFLFLVQICTA